VSVDEILKLEKRVVNYNQDLELAVISCNKNRQRKYQKSIQETKKQIRQLERDLTIDDIKGLRETARNLNNRIAELQF